MLKMLVIFALLFIAPDLLAYDGETFPLNGLRFQGYEGTDSKPMYELGWFLLWLGWPFAAFICLTAYSGCQSNGESVGCIGTVLTFLVCGGLCLFWLVNLDYFLGYTVGLLIFGAGCAGSQAKKLFK
jgi:hypothetical protein